MARFCFAVLALTLGLITSNVHPKPTPLDDNLSVKGGELVVSNPEIKMMKSFIDRREELINLYFRKEYEFVGSINRNAQFLFNDMKEDNGPKPNWNARPMFNFQNDRKTDNFDATLKEYLGILSNDIMYPKWALFYSDASRKSPQVGFSYHFKYDRFPDCPDMVAKFMPAPFDNKYMENLVRIGKVIGMAILNKQFMDVDFEDALYEMISNTKYPEFLINYHSHNYETSIDYESTPFKPKTTTSYSLAYVPSIIKTNSDFDYELKGFGLHFKDNVPLIDAMLMINEFEANHSLFSIAVLCQGIYTVIPKVAFARFNKEEIRTLISGDTREMQLSDWQQISAINFQEYDEQQPVRWFWDYIKDVKKPDQHKLLSIITGTSRLPLGVLHRSVVSDCNDGIIVPVGSNTPFVDIKCPGECIQEQCHKRESDVVTEPAASASKPYINIVWTGKMDYVPTSDPYTNTLYLSSYSSYEVFAEYMNKLIKPCLEFRPGFSPLSNDMNN